MRRVSACAFLILLASCSASGGDGPASVVNPNTPNGGSTSAPSSGGTGGTSNPTGTVGGSGNIFEQDGCTNGCAFSVDPLLDANVTLPDIAPFDGDATFQPGSFCVVEPQL